MFRRIFSYNKKNICSFIIGVLVSIINGLVYPCFSIFLSDIINTLFNLAIPSKVGDARKEANLASLVFLFLAIGTFVMVLLQNFLFSLVGNEVTRNIRKETYYKILRMPIPWFDYPENSTGNLAARLAMDCQTVNGMITTYIMIIFQSISTLIAGLIVAFVFEWRTSLVALALMPLLMLSGAIRAGFRTGLADKSSEAYKESSTMIMESMVNIRTVVSFGVENTVVSKYNEMLNRPYAFMIRTGIFTGFTFGLSQLLMFVVFAVIFYIGTIFVRDAGVSILNVFTAIYSIFFAAVTVGNNSHFMPDIAAAKVAAASLFEILDSEDEDQMQIREQSELLTTGITGNIKLENVAFKYDSRNNYVFQNMNVEIKSGQKIAFVGASGCGKSTIMQLLQRFYFPEQGTITLDGKNIKDYDIHYLRNQFGVVSQEPVLFNGTFRDNIKYNLDTAQEQDIRDAAKQSNALSFIEGDEQLAIITKQTEKEKKEENKQKRLSAKIYPKSQQHKADKLIEQSTEGRGFDKNVGIKGSHISGGQKQRVAIARAILRSPNILLLDEATSALDSINERRVQESLDRIMTGKTTISIAHRIDTIRNSDEILVFEKGEIVERGIYSSLLALKGYFFNLERGTQFV